MTATGLPAWVLCFMAGLKELFVSQLSAAVLFFYDRAVRFCMAGLKELLAAQLSAVGLLG